MKQKPHYIKCGPVPVVRNWRELPIEELTRAEVNMRFCESYMNIPTSDRGVVPLTLIPEQECFFYAVFDNPHGTRRAIYSLARRNGKSFLVACILLCFLVGPEAKYSTLISSGAMSREQASIIFHQSVEVIECSPKLKKHIVIVQSSKILRGIRMRTEYRSLASEGATTVGWSFILVLVDEAGQIKGPSSPFIDALISSQGSHKNPLIIYFSTQAPSDNDLFSRLIDDSITSQDPHTVCHLYTAPDDCDLLDPAAWKMANPGLDIFRDRKDLEEQLKQASRLPSLESSARNYLLNQRVDADASYVPKKVWEENGDPPESMRGKKVYGGLDLSAVSDLTGLVFIDDDGNVDVHAWLPGEGLKEKSRDDRVPYDIWEKKGFLKTTPGRAIQYEWVAKEIYGLWQMYDIQQINFDRYNMKFLRPWLVKAGFTEKDLEKFTDFGQGFVSMGAALRALETALLSKSLKHGNHPVLTMCMANAKIEMDAAGGRKFTKKKARGRIDLAVCIAMAEDARSAHKVKEKKGWSVHFV